MPGCKVPGLHPSCATQTSSLPFPRGGDDVLFAANNCRGGLQDSGLATPCCRAQIRDRTFSTYFLLELSNLKLLSSSVAGAKTHSCIKRWKLRISRPNRPALLTFGCPDSPCNIKTAKLERPGLVKSAHATGCNTWAPCVRAQLRLQGMAFLLTPI